MENAEEVMQLLEEFSKTKPKEIPKELEDYLGYVAKSGDPVFQWAIVKILFREKLSNVITDFYETSATVDLPPCPNVEPFNYERMKTSLLERFDTFSSAPFTVQRICELLTNPRKEYNRVDKYMRAIEKNILVVSTREPGSGKRPLECDQTEMFLNGMPDVKLSDVDGSFLHVPTDLPYLGAPPASNDVTVETTEPNSSKLVHDTVVSDINGVSKEAGVGTDNGKSWQIQEPPVSTAEIVQAGSTSETINVIDSCSDTRPKSPEENCAGESDCDTNNKLINVENIDPISSFEGESSSDMVIKTNQNEILDTGSIDSSESLLDSSEVQISSKTSFEETDNVSDENEVSSTPEPITLNRVLISEEVEEPADSEAEATGIDFVHCPKSESNTVTDIESSEGAVDEGATKSINLVTITEISEASAKSDEMKCFENEIDSTGTVISPPSPTSNVSAQQEDVNFDDQNSLNIVVVEEDDKLNLQPDSSNDAGLSLENEAESPIIEHLQRPETCSEADFVSNTNLDLTVLDRKTDVTEATPDQTSTGTKIGLHESIIKEPSTFSSNEPTSLVLGNTSEGEQSNISLGDSDFSSNMIEGTIACEESCSGLVEEDSKLNTINEINASGVVVEETFDQERREETVIQSPTNIVSDSSKEIVTVEDISVDPSCEVEEAMDVDDSSNQMMVSEGENEGEPMDQSEQLQS